MNIDKIKEMPFIEKRQELLRGLFSNCNYSVGKHEILNPIAIVCNRGDKYYATYTPEFKVYDLKEGDDFLNGETFDGLNFNPSWNTRDILLSEAVLEIEKGTWEENIKGFWAVCDSLTKNEIEFYAFYSEGMRTPHIHIYDLFPQVEDWAEKEMSVALFCRKIIPLEYFHLIDTALWGEHTISLEFSKHWKYGTMNRLMWWNIPEVNQCN